jgi:hypothetical protein
VSTYNYNGTTDVPIMKKIMIVRIGMRRINNDIAKIIVPMPRIKSQLVVKSMRCFHSHTCCYIIIIIIIIVQPVSLPSAHPFDHILRQLCSYHMLSFVFYEAP